jgi:hypothetical protein
MKNFNNKDNIVLKKECHLNSKSVQEIDCKSYSLISTKTAEASSFIYYKTALLEIVLWCLTWPGPFLHFPLVYITTGVFLVVRYFKGEEAAYSTVANMWSFYTSCWHRQKFVGLENILTTGSSVLAWYHGPVPIDYWGLVCQVYKRDRRLITTIVDMKLVNNLPFSGIIMKCFKCDALSKVSCVDLLDDGHLIGVAPGGAREAMYDTDYDVLWGKRDGFAKVAVLTGAPIIPIFTENIRLAYCTVTTPGKLLKFIYDMTKLPIAPMYGGFPVQLTTHIGTPITPRKGETAQMLKERVKVTMVEMVNKWQKNRQSMKKLDSAENK